MKRLVDVGAITLALLWAMPLIYAIWAAFHTAEYSTTFDLSAPWTLENFRYALNSAPFYKYFLNTVFLVSIILVSQLVLCSLAAFALVRFEFRGREIVFYIILMQLMIVPAVLIMENYRTLSTFALTDSLIGMAMPYVASAFGIFLLRQSFKSVPKELEDAAMIEGSSTIGLLFRVYIPLCKPVYVAYALVSISYHWNNFLLPLILSNSAESRVLTVALSLFSSPEMGVNWSVIGAATLISIAPLFIAFLIFQKQFVASFMHTGVK